MADPKQQPEPPVPTLEEIVSKAGFGSFEELWNNLEKDEKGTRPPNKG